jgi:hypothetical protein
MNNIRTKIHTSVDISILKDLVQTNIIVNDDDNKHIKATTMDPNSKKQILGAYELEIVREKPCNPRIAFHSLPKTRYLNNQIVSNTCERYVDLNKKNKDTKEPNT